MTPRKILKGLLKFVQVFMAALILAAFALATAIPLIITELFGEAEKNESIKSRKGEKCWE